MLDQERDRGRRGGLAFEPKTHHNKSRQSYAHYLDLHVFRG